MDVYVPCYRTLRIAVLQFWGIRYGNWILARGSLFGDLPFPNRRFNRGFKPGRRAFVTQAEAVEMLIHYITVKREALRKRTHAMLLTKRQLIENPNSCVVRS